MSENHSAWHAWRAKVRVGMNDADRNVLIAEAVTLLEQDHARPLTPHEKHKVSDQVYFMTLPTGATGATGPSSA